MKKIIILGITFYQVVINDVLKNILGAKCFCRFSPTCSEYAKQRIEEKGVLKGGLFSIIRLSKCHPFARNV